MSDAEIDLFKISDDLFERKMATGYASLSELERVFSSVWQVEAEVNNGGFHQFFFNSDPWEQVVDTPGALEAIGAPKMAAVVRKAIEQVEEIASCTDWGDRQVQVDALSEEICESLERLDEAFYEYPEDLNELLTQFVRKHRSDFSA